MLSTSASGDVGERLLTDREKHPVRIASDNPFMPSTELGFDVNEKKSLESFYEIQKQNLESETLDRLGLKQIRAAAVRLERRPANVQLINNMGLEYLNQGDFENAIDWFERALILDRHSFTVLANLAKAHAAKGDTKKALDIYFQMEKRDPDNVKVLNNIANLLICKNEFEKAKGYLERVTEYDKTNIAALTNLSMVSLIENKTDRAINLLRQALAIKPDVPSALNNLGVCFTLKRSPKKAIKHFLAAHALDKRDAGTLVNLANAYHAQGSIEKAMQLLEDFLKTVGENQQVRETLAWMYAAAKIYKKSYVHLLQLLRNLETDSENTLEKARVLNNLGVVMQSTGDFGSAQTYYLQSLSIKPVQSPVALYNLIQLNFAWNRDSVAKELIDQGLVDFPDDLHIKAFLGRYYFEIEDYGKASALLSEVITVAPREADCYATLSIIEMEINKDYDKADAILRKGLSVYRNNVTFLNNLAYLDLLRDDITSARKILDRMQDQDFFVAATRGLLLLKEGNVQEGQRLYNQAKGIVGHGSFLASLVEQKKCLEVAKYYQKSGDKDQAERLLKKAISIRGKYEYYRNEAKRLLGEIES